MEQGPVLVYGLSRSGVAAIALLRKLGRRVLYWDDSKDHLDAVQASTDCQALSGGPATARAAGVTTAVLSPGIPPQTAGVQSLLDDGISCISELELAWQQATAPVVVVTGTNGKSSTATMIDGLLRAAGHTSVLCGNIGLPFSRVLAEETAPPDWYVVEASSYQLALSPTLRPAIVVYTNYAPDHLSWHGGPAGYVAAKASVALRLEEPAVVVYPLQAGPLAEAVSKTAATKVTLGGNTGRAMVRLDTRSGTVSTSSRRFSLTELAGQLAYQWRFVSCAIHCTYAVAQALDIDDQAFSAAVLAFQPLAHRLEKAGSVGNIDFINDSKATNIDSTQYALKMCSGPLVLILGGRHKGTSYRELLPFFGSKVKSVVALGEAQDLIIAELADVVPVLAADDFDDALEKALHAAARLTLPATGERPTVLLSPACSSFDMFANFEQRGAAFTEWVRQRSAEAVSV